MSDYEVTMRWVVSADDPTEAVEQALTDIRMHGCTPSAEVVDLNDPD